MPLYKQSIIINQTVDISSIENEISSQSTAIAALEAQRIKQQKSLSIPGLAIGADYLGIIELSKTFALLTISTTANIRNRIYLNSAYRNADLARAVGSSPSLNSGLIFEGIFTNSIQTINLNPVAVGYSANGIYPMTVTNLSANSLTSFDINFNYLPLEQ